MKLRSILPLIRRFAPADDCSSSFTQWHSKTPAGGLRFRSSRSFKITAQQKYFVFRESACSSPSARNNRQRHTDSALSVKLSRPVICSSAGRRYTSGRAVSLNAGAGLYDHADQWRLLFERSALGAAVTDSAFRFLMVNPAFLTMVGYSREELQQLSLLDICKDGEGDERRVPLRELREGVRLQYELETQYRRRTELLFRSTRTFQRLAGARRISKCFLRSQSTLQRVRQPKMPCGRLNRSLGGLLD
jgi:PAS domain S-box-containing protein